MKQTSRAAALPSRSENAPVEVNLVETAAKRLSDDPSIDVYVNLEEIEPGDPGEMSGAHIRIMGSGEHALLCAYFGTHCLGTVGAGAVSRALGLYGAFDVTLWSPRPGSTYAAPTGVTTVIDAEQQELRLMIRDTHCFGVLRGPLFREFLDCLKRRSRTSAKLGKVVNIESARGARDLVCNCAGQTEVLQ